jgi:hypothetical protein
MKNLFKQLKLKDAEYHHYILTAVLAIFIVFPITIPDVLADIINNTVGKVVIVIIALNMFLLHPMVGALGLLAAYELIKRAETEKHDVRHPKHRFMPIEAKNTAHLSEYNQFPVTVEEEVIATQIPYVFNKTMVSSSYKPVQDGLQGAAKL